MDLLKNQADLNFVLFLPDERYEKVAQYLKQCPGDKAVLSYENSCLIIEDENYHQIGKVESIYGTIFQYDNTIKPTLYSIKKGDGELMQPYTYRGYRLIATNKNIAMIHKFEFK